MSSDRRATVRVFFYGLYMDESLLEAKGIKPAAINVGFLDGFSLRIGERATLVRHPGGRAYGVTMNLAAGQAEKLYAERSVADYVPELVTVELLDGKRVAANCYNLPREKVAGINKDYADSLLDVATRLGFPDSYLGQIRQVTR